MSKSHICPSINDAAGNLVSAHWKLTRRDHSLIEDGACQRCDSGKCLLNGEACAIHGRKVFGEELERKYHHDTATLRRHLRGSQLCY